MRLSLKRITSSGNFIPEIDGLRFIAIVSVVFYHIAIWLNVKDLKLYSDTSYYPYLFKVFKHGDIGVPLFFVISGFILGIPFANYHIKKDKRVDVRNYFLRRLTRLEPPYIVIMTVLFFASVYVAKTLSIDSGIASYFSSLFYIHNFIYGENVIPLLNPVAWSLEIEVQFYILAPLIAYIFAVTSPALRRVSLIILTLVILLINYSIDLTFISLINFLQYFLVGFLLADCYVSKSTLLPKTKFDFLIGSLLFLIIWFVDKGDFNSIAGKLLWDLVLLSSIFIIYYYVIFHKAFKFMAFAIITNIGGMCYSIYLLHYWLIIFFGKPLINYTFSEIKFVNTIIYFLTLLIPIIIVCSIFFLTIEKPCMERDWFKKYIMRRIKPNMIATANGPNKNK